MWYRYYEQHSPKRIITYFLYIILVFWFFITLILEYQFLSQNWEQINKKGGTFVEAIFNQVSYLPYLKNDWQSVFYQSFLFDACVDYKTLNEEGTLDRGLCKVITQDYQTYHISLKDQEKKRSDNTPFSLEDVFFTYETIIRKNIWDIKPLTTYQDITIALENDKLKIVFPTSTTDNNFFFTHYILPKHILQHADLESYTTIFAANPISSSCGKIHPQSNDPDSLVFDLTKCEDTNLAFYQIKDYKKFENFSKSVIESNNQLVDVYASQVNLENYKRINVVNSKLLTLFFNTKSDKMKVRLRRALGGLINKNFYNEEYNKFLKKYSSGILNTHLSDGTNIEEFINRISLDEKDEEIQHQDLKDSGVSELKKSIKINGVDRKFLFYTQKPEKPFDLEINFSNEFEKISIKDQKGNEFSPKNYNKKRKKVTYKLEFDKNLQKGLNQYTIYGTIKKKSYVIANIDLYCLEGIRPPQDETLKRKINVVYYNNLESNFAIQQIRTILSEAKILENFLFEQVSSPEELEAKLILGNYDIILNTINLGMKKDILKILTTDDVMINPSKYTNPNLINLFKQYTKSPQKETLSSQINGIFSQDMPFVILGYPFEFINIKSKIISPSFWSGTTMYDYNWREYLYSKLALVHNTKIDFEQLKDVKGFLNELKEKINRKLPFPAREEKKQQSEETLQEHSEENTIEEIKVEENREEAKPNSPENQNNDDLFERLLRENGLIKSEETEI